MKRKVIGTQITAIDFITGRRLVGVQVAQPAGVDPRRLPVLQPLGLSLVGEHQ